MPAGTRKNRSQSIVSSGIFNAPLATTVTPILSLAQTEDGGHLNIAIACDDLCAIFHILFGQLATPDALLATAWPASLRCLPWSNSISFTFHLSTSFCAWKRRFSARLSMRSTCALRRSLMFGLNDIPLFGCDLCFCSCKCTSFFFSFSSPEACGFVEMQRSAHSKRTRQIHQVCSLLAVQKRFIAGKILSFQSV